MQKSQLLASIISFLTLGVAIVFVIGLFIVLAYIMLWGFILGIILWGIFYIKELFFSRHHKSKTGRVINHDEVK